ncbi:hypothetical protein [Streptomyces aureoverticillatus]|uniref:hypothetical protein n=1 Tax=Streptomyces aureoverticillatus TaxID=66871 RepID=UPI0013DA59D8|nr:hypothetical protein [Streptomyces aureoverticillatus]QIB49491.1 hypothetical protein G3H79_40680 [Streptomyces aureoverticillatus]
MRATSENTVTVYNIDWDLNWTLEGTLREPWDRLTAETADEYLALSRAMGETVAEQEYFAADRFGQIMRIVLLRTTPEAHQSNDSDVVYVYAL